MSESESYSGKSAAETVNNAEDSNSEDDECETANFDDCKTSNAHPLHSDKDISSDESLKDDHYEYNKNGKKSFKPKVKIKTLTIDGQLVYFCKICDKIFTRRKDKLNHELAHSGESVLTCNECGKEYLHESSLASHMRTHDGDPLYMCDLCPKMFAQSHHLKSHILSHSEPTSFVCKTCYREFAMASDLNHHCRVQIKMEMSKYWCKMCKIYMCRGHNLTNDKRLHAFICSACNEFFYTNKKLKIHMKKFAHYSTEKAKCIEPLQEYELYPQKITDSLRKLSAQKEIEAGKKRGRGDIQCSQNVVENSEDELPAKRFKLTSRKVFLEEEYSSTSLQESLSELKVEQDLKSPNKHRKGKPYCKKCNRSFKDNFELDRHKAQVHNEENSGQPLSLLSNADDSTGNMPETHDIKQGDQSLNCPVCGENFISSVQLTSHLKSHSEELEHKCSHCGKGFQHKVNATFAAKFFHFRYKFLNHLHLHTNVKCFQCYICHKSFATKHYLQRHLQVHLRQGMDVDLSNIIVDEDCKVGISEVRFQNDRLSIMDLASQEIENHLSSIRDSHEVMSRERKSNNSDCLLQSSNFININGKDIKIEPLQESDSESENSGCSYMTRDSERSDPFRFSSDESNSFKTTMAKERRRLKRKWLQLARQALPLKS
ncbi:hypothetical protein Btru_001976 [Bulinus truncatus]|nr:hypothetical protein Btru_001976 [Bulinus truncatus]